MPRIPVTNHLPSNDDEEEESIQEEEEEEEEDEEDEEEVLEEEGDEEEYEEVDKEVVGEEDDDDDEADQRLNREKEEEEDEGDDDASPADRPTAITPTKSSKRSASPVDVDLDHINPKRLKNNKSSFQQRTTWTLQDELILLNAIIDFKKSHNLDPLSDIDSFFRSIKHSLRLQVSTQQLKRKIRGLKDKFNTYAIRAGATKNAKPNDSELYNLSMKIWGQNQNQNEEEEEGVKEEDDTIATMTTPQKTITPEQRDNNNSTTFLVSPQLSQHDQVSLSHYPYLSRSLHSCQNWTGGLPGSGLGETLAKEGIALIQKSKAEELDRRFRMQQIQETEIYLNRIALIRDQTKLILDALKSSMS